MKSIKRPSKTHREKLEVPTESAVPCELKAKQHPDKLLETDSVTRRSNKIQETKHACIAEAHESTRKRLESTLPMDHKDHIAEKGFKSTSHYNLKQGVTGNCSEWRHSSTEEDQVCLKSGGSSRRKGLEKLPAWQLTKVKSKKEIIPEAQKRAKNSPYADGHLSSRKCGVGTEVSKVRSPRSSSEVTL